MVVVLLCSVCDGLRMISCYAPLAGGVCPDDYPAEDRRKIGGARVFS